MSSNKVEVEITDSEKKTKSRQKGSAIVLALFVLAMVGAFVAIALTRTSTEAAAMGNEAAEGRTFYASQGCLEMMTRNFNKIFETKLTPTETDKNRVIDKDNFPGLSTSGGGQFNFTPELDQTDANQTSKAETLPDGPFAGLYALQDNWRLRCTGTDTTTNTQVQLTRNILNNRVPIFQFGIFYDDDLELYRPPLFSFGGRVHSNRHFFISPGSEGVYFDSRVTAVGHIVTESWRNGYSGDSNNGTWIKDASGTFRQLSRSNGSVKNGSGNVLRTDPANSVTDFPASVYNTNWATTKATFDGNLLNAVKPLKLPLKIGEDADNTNLIEMIKRGKSPAHGTFLGDSMNTAAPNANPVISAVPDTVAARDNDIMKSERFANKPGIRVSLSDSKAKLPGCATADDDTYCGMRLDGNIDPEAIGKGPATGNPADKTTLSRGYQPKAMKKASSDTTYTYVPTRVNGERLYAGNQVWIKVELVDVDETNGDILTKDVTQEFLSLGVTEVPTSVVPAPLALVAPFLPTCSVTTTPFCINGYTGTLATNGTPTSPSFNLTAATAQTASTYPDSRSIIKLQRWDMPARNSESGTTSAIPNDDPSSATTKYMSHYSLTGFGGTLNSNVVRRYRNVLVNFTDDWCALTCTVEDVNPSGGDLEKYGHVKRAQIGSVLNDGIVPFPIKMFDSREGLFNDIRNTTNYPNGSGIYDNYKRLSRAGVMSMVDIDIANLRRLLRGDFDGLFPVGTPFTAGNSGVSLASTDFPENGGWVLYVSDRRGDYDFDGQYDMEDVYGAAPGNNDTKESGEDINFNTFLDRRFCQNASDLSCEAERYNTRTVYPDEAASTDHKYYRRGVRLINGTVLPGIYDATTASNTRGFTVAAENGIYVEGNYNATGLSATPPANANSAYNNYLPFDTATHIPASIVADSVTILSNSWNDSQSFITALIPSTSPSPSESRVAATTTVRFAMISGDTIATKIETPNQGTTASGERMNGGVHNFKRFLEHWTGKRLDYSGSLINLFNSQNNNAPFKCCGTVYNPPRRNWVFDSTFLDPRRLPPGTPFFQYVQTTGFERTNH